MCMSGLKENCCEDMVSSDTFNNIMVFVYYSFFLTLATFFSSYNYTELSGIFYNNNNNIISFYAFVSSFPYSWSREATSISQAERT